MAQTFAAPADAPSIRAVGPDETAMFPALARLLAGAYPITKVDSNEKLEAMATSLRGSASAEGTQWRVAEVGGRLAGAMRVYDYTMNLRGRDVAASGVGSVAVALDRKRRGIAHALLGEFLESSRAAGARLALLYPFKFDFYRALGFGYGTPMHRYRFAAAALRSQGADGEARLLSLDDVDAVLACGERVRARTNGLIQHRRWVVERLVGEAALRYVGVERDGVLRGFMQTSVEHGDDRERNRDTLVVRDVHAEDDGVTAALLAYLRRQSDQFARVVIETQDDAFYLAAERDPGDGSGLSVAPPSTHRIAETGLGVMYRILDVPGALAHLGGAYEGLILRVEVEDPFFAPTRGAWTMRFGPDAAPVQSTETADGTLRIGIAELSSAVAGSLRLRDALRHRLARVEPAGLAERVDALFRCDTPPRCMTRF